MFRARPSSARRITNATSKSSPPGKAPGTKCAPRKRKIRAAYRAGEIDDVLKPENKTAHYKELEVEFNKLIAEQRKILVKMNSIKSIAAPAARA